MTREDDFRATAEALLNELERLRVWKAEALTVLAAWDAVWEAAGRPGHPGESKAEAVHEWINRRNLGQAAH